MKCKTILVGLLTAVLVFPVQHSFGQKQGMANKLVYNYRFAPNDGLVNKMEKEFRKEICLNGYWDFQPVRLPSSYKQGKGVAPELTKPVEENWSNVRIKIPSPWNINTFANRGLEGTDHRNFPSYPSEWDHVKMAWMRKMVMVPAAWENQQIQLHFEAVAGCTEVYVNNEKVGENFDLFLPFDLDITDKVKPGETAEILVGVRSQSIFEDNSTVGRRIVPAGSMWGTTMNGIWQDVFMVALPKVHVENVYVKPLVSQNKLEVEVAVRNITGKKVELQLKGEINEWINLAGTDINSAPVPAWELGEKAMDVPAMKVSVPANSVAKVLLSVPVADELKYWTPETPNLYALLLSLGTKKQTIDVKYERFGWREWTLKDTQQCLNGRPYQLRADSWHFMGVPQLTRRYAWAWFTAIKGMNGNAVRPHAQVYPRFYLDVADEMGICVLDETANWASDGGPKLDSDLFWQASKNHLRRFVMRDRNHASVFGWSISNENKPVILHVYNHPELMEPQKVAWKEWRDIVRELDPTRPWISSDGEDDGEGILPVTVGHYGDMNSMKHWVAIGKPWGIGEHSMAYYGTPKQVSKYNGERAYESQQGRMEGLANECYHLLVAQREMGASYSTVFNMAWYSLKPLPLGKKDLSTAPDIHTDGVFFGEFVEGVPGVQPERVGPYCTTFNPGYDPSLPLYDPWPMYEAMRAANAPNGPAWSPYATIVKSKYEAPKVVPVPNYKEVCFIGNAIGSVKEMLDAQGVIFTAEPTTSADMLYIMDGSYVLSAAEQEKVMKHINKGADVWVLGLEPQALDSYNRILPYPIALDNLKRSSFIPVQKSWMRGINNSDFYFCEIQHADVSEHTLTGLFVEEGEVLLNACKTNWRSWNGRGEDVKTAGTVRSANECKAATPVFVKCQGKASTFYVSANLNFVNSEQGFNTMSAILKNAGIHLQEKEVKSDELFFLRDNQVKFPVSSKQKFRKTANGYVMDVYVYSPRPLDDLLIEPNMPKLSVVLREGIIDLSVNGKRQALGKKVWLDSFFNEVPLKQGWNELTIVLKDHEPYLFEGYFKCDNRREFLQELKVSFSNPEAN